MQAIFGCSLLPSECQLVKQGKGHLRRSTRSCHRFEGLGEVFDVRWTTAGRHLDRVLLSDSKTFDILKESR